MPGVRRVKRALPVFRCRVEQANEWAVPSQKLGVAYSPQSQSCLRR